MDAPQAFPTMAPNANGRLDPILGGESDLVQLGRYRSDVNGGDLNDDYMALEEKSQW